jgi:hypothetical protein
MTSSFLDNTVAWPQLLSKRDLHSSGQGSTWPPSSKNVQIVTERKVLLLHNRPTTESAYKPRDDQSRKLRHAVRDPFDYAQGKLSNRSRCSLR